MPKNSCAERSVSRPDALSLGSSDERESDDEDGGEEAEGDWLVPHGYLSEDEGADMEPVKSYLSSVFFWL